MIAGLWEDYKKHKVELDEADNYKYEVSGTNIGLITGLAVTCLMVSGAGFLILKKRRDEYWLDDENEGGEYDYFNRFV